MPICAAQSHPTHTAPPTSHKRLKVDLAAPAIHAAPGGKAVGSAIERQGQVRGLVLELSRSTQVLEVLALDTCSESLYYAVTENGR